MTSSYRALNAGLVALAVAAAGAGCGGSSGDGSGAPAAAVAVSGTVAAANGGGTTADLIQTGDPFRIRATGSTGAIYETEADRTTGRFTLMLPPNDAYVVGFEHGDMMDAATHFAGYMVFGCATNETDHFFVSGRERAIVLGTIRVRQDGGFARPERNPLDQLDRDGDRTPDARDPDTRCGDVGDRDHDGFYDDDMNHDGHHDSDMDRDGLSACEMMGTGQDNKDDDCSGLDMTGAPDRTPTITRTRAPTVTGATPIPDNHGH